MSDPFPSLGALLSLGLAEKTRMEHDRQAQEERYLSADIVKRLGLAGLAVGVLGLIWSYMPAHADQKPMPAFTQDCKPALEVLGRLMLERHESPWKAGMVDDKEFIITRNEETKVATFLMTCDQEALTGDIHKPMASRVVPQLRVMFTFIIGDVDFSSLPWVHA